MPADLPLIAVDAEVLLKCLDCLFRKFVNVRVVGSGEAEVDARLSIKLFKKL